VGVRFRKYLSKGKNGKYSSICKNIDCKGKKGKHCPPNRPRNLNGEYVKCGTWVVELFDESNQWKSVVYRDVRNRSDAERRFAVAIGDREREVLRLPRRRNNMPTLAEYCKQYLESAGNDKENTFLSKTRAVKALIKHLGGYKLDRITKFLIEKYCIDRKNKDAVKGATVNLDVNILSNILNRAIDKGIVDKNPCSKVKRFIIEQKRDRVLTGDEIASILDKLKGKDRLMVLIGLFGGLRLGETLSLRKRDIDFSRNVMTFVQIKTGKLINVPISGFLAQELKEYMINYQGERIFDSRDVNLSLVKKYSRYFAHLFKKLGIDRFTYHNLRHCFSSSLSDSGADAFTTQSLLGHSDVSMTARYTHKQIEAKRNAIEGMTEHVLSMGKKGKISKLRYDETTT
jgi:integrase